MIGRTAGLLVDIAVEVRPSGYRVTARPGRDQRRAVDLLRADLDAFDEAIDPVRPPWVKVQAAGPVDARGVGRAALRPQGAHRPRRRARGRREPHRGAARARRRGGGAHRGRGAAAARRAVAARGADRAACPPRPATARSARCRRRRPRTCCARSSRRSAFRWSLHCCADRPPLDVLGAVGAVAIGVDATLPSVAGRTASPAALDALRRGVGRGHAAAAGHGARPRPRRPPDQPRAGPHRVRPGRPARLRPRAPRPPGRPDPDLRARGRRPGLGPPRAHALPRARRGVRRPARGPRRARERRSGVCAPRTSSSRRSFGRPTATGLSVRLGSLAP